MITNIWVGVLLAEKTSNGLKNYSYVCKLFKRMGRTENGEVIKIRDGYSKYLIQFRIKK